MLAASISVAVSALIVLSLVGEAWAFVSTVDLGSLTEIGWFPRRGLFEALMNWMTITSFPATSSWPMAPPERALQWLTATTS